MMMSNLSEEDIARIMEADSSGEIVVPYGDDITDYLTEWENLISELSNKEVMLYHRKTVYQQESDRIIAETNFKELYGANNQKVRDNHVKTVLAKDYEVIKALEFSIDWIGRRISFLRELVKTKRVLMEVKQ